MIDILNQGPGLALEILVLLNKLIDGESSSNKEQMDAKGEKASKAFLVMLNARSKEEVFAVLASMSAVHNISDFLFDDTLGYIEGKWGLTEIQEIDPARN